MEFDTEHQVLFMYSLWLPQIRKISEVFGPLNKAHPTFLGRDANQEIEEMLQFLDPNIVEVLQSRYHENGTGSRACRNDKVSINRENSRNGEISESRNARISFQIRRNLLDQGKCTFLTIDRTVCQ